MYKIVHKLNPEQILHEHGKSAKECVEHAVASKISMRFADMRSADMHSANMHYADMRFADMRSADMHSANMHYADMHYADMRSADMSFADMRFADMSSADMSSADMRSADMSSADMRSADMSSANMSFADMRSADIKGADFHNTDMRFCKRDDDAKIARLDVCEWSVTVQNNTIHIGCKQFALDEIMNMTEEIAATHNAAAPVRWRRWGKAIQALAQATLG